MAKYTDARYPDKINDLVDNDGNVNIPGGEYTIMDINDSEAEDPAVLKKVYNTAPHILRVTTAVDGIQMYRLQMDARGSVGEITYSCLLFNSLIELTFVVTGELRQKIFKLQEQ